MIVQKQRERSCSTPRRSAQFSDNDASTPKASAEASQERDPTATKSIDRSLQYQQQQTGRVASLAMSGNLGSLGVSDYDSGTGRNDTDELDAIWDELDNIELDSQTMRQLTETEEQFYATQQFVESMDLALSQEFTDPKHDSSVNGRSVTRCTSADGGSAHGQRVVPPGPSTRSVPVTPSSGNPVYISDSDSPGNSAVEKSLSHGQSATNASKDYAGSLDYTQDKQQQSGRHGKPTAWMSPLTSTSTSSRGKVNLYNRLAQHIPPRPDNDLVTSNRLPPTMQNHMIHKAQERNQHTQLRRYKPESLSLRTTTEPTIDLNTSTLTPPSSRTKQQHGYSTITQRPNGALIAPESPSNHIHVDHSHFAEEIERLRAENERMRAETDQLKAQLYTKDGEVRIVRDNLSRTEINYTQLQEQLANQKSRSEIDHKLVEGKLQNEIDRLKTELFFQQQEAQVTAISVVGSGGATQTPRTPRTSHTPKRARNVEESTSSNTIATAGGASDYPTMEEFSSIPSQGITKRTKMAGKEGLGPELPKQANNENAVVRQANAMLLEMLKDIVDQSEAEISNMVSLSIQLSSVIGDSSKAQIDTFQSKVCNILATLAHENSYRQLTAVLRLLLRVLTELDEFCAAWLHDPTAYKTDIHMSDPLSNGVADGAGSSSLGNHRISQLSAVLNSALRSAIRAAPGLQLKNTNCIDFAMAVSLQCKLISRVIAMRPEAALSDIVWRTFDPCLETDPLLKHCEDLDALVGVLELVTILVQVSPESWGFIRSAPASFEQLLLAAIRHLQHAPVDNDDLVLDGERSLLVLIASAIVTHEEDTPMLVNGMKVLASTLVQWFIDKHRSLTSKHRNRKRDSPRRLQVFFEYTKCLNVVLSEVDDVAELLGGDNSPLFFAFVTTCTRMSIGESAFVDISSMRELATDLLAYVVTEEQAMSIQGLIA
ncbi:hypothetical protein LPJ72_001764 [Coemansia sp. Benny D160-2]|nr:hypothetical protein LPJ72_001764 [Coemansia sp. Benny D160-2]